MQPIKPIESIESNDIFNTKNRYGRIFEDENTRLNESVSTFLEPYFGTDVVVAPFEEKKQWFKNLLFIAQHEVGLSHSIQHNQACRSIISLTENDELKNKILNAPFSENIGAFAVVKPSDNIEFNNSDCSIHGSKRWLTNIETATYVIFNTKEQSSSSVKYVYLDLKNISHTINVDYPNISGMRIAMPGDITIPRQTIPRSWMLGEKGHYSKFFHEEVIHQQCFFTNLVGISIALYKLVKHYSKIDNTMSGLNLQKIEIDVSALIMLWEERINDLTDIDDLRNDEFWHKQRTLYLFGKKTLQSILKQSIEFGIQIHCESDSTRSKCFRDAMTFSSHMTKLHSTDAYLYKTYKFTYDNDMFKL
jgi:hypothetical protein